MIVETFRFKGSDSTEIFTHSWLPDEADSVKAVIQVAHGMAEHSARYERFGKYMTDAGYAVYANDHRGHGQTSGMENLGVFAESKGWELVVEDMARLTSTIKEKHPGLPVFLLGHSMGSFLSRDYIASYGDYIDGVILSATGGDPGIMGNLGMMVATMESAIKGKMTKSPLMDKLSFGSFNKAFRPNRTSFDWLSSDPDEVDKYVNDPLCGEVCTAGFFQDLLGGIRKINKKESVKSIPKTLPVYFFSGSNDPVGNMTRGVKQVYEVYKNAGIQDLSIRFYEGGRHEMLNETNRDEVYNDIIQWCDNHLPGKS